MTKAIITLDTELETKDADYEVHGITLPEGATGNVLKVEEDRVFIEWTYYLGSSPWASESNVSEWVDLDDWAAWTLLGMEEPDED